MDSVNAIAVADRVDVNRSAPVGALDVTPFIGCWLSTNRETQGIAKLVVRSHRDGVRVQGFGAGVPSVCAWGEVEATVFADSPSSTMGHAFRAVYDFGFKETVLQAKVKKGVLVVATFNRFTDGSRRASYFAREFFYRVTE